MVKNFTHPVPRVDHRLLLFQEAGQQAKENFELAQCLQEALLPYFAMGFTPTFTPSTHKKETSQCGFIALARSYNAAGTALGITDFRPTSVEELKTMFKEGDCQAFITRNYYAGGGLDKDLELAFKASNLEEGSIAALLEYLNADRQTHFQLGIISEGYSCGEYQSCHSAQLYGSTAVDSPVLWIFNDNKRIKQTLEANFITAQNAKIPSGLGKYNPSKSEKASLEAGSDIEAHWECFELNPNLGDVTDSRANRVRGYGIGARMQEDIGRGVWVLTEDIVHPSGLPALQRFAAYAGSFLREVSQATPLEIPRGFLHMTNSAGQRGLVDKKILRKIEIASWAPGSDTDPGSNNTTWQQKRIREMLFENRAFKIFKSIPFWTKAGEALETKKNENGTEQLMWNELLRDTGKRTMITRAIVQKVNGEDAEFEIQMCRLQNMERPWGFPEVLPILKKVETNMHKKSINELQAIARSWGVAYKRKTREELHDALRLWAMSHYKRLTLHRLSSDIQLAGEDVVALQQGEIVFLVSRSKQGVAIVRDVEGIDYEIGANDLEKDTIKFMDLVYASEVLNDIEKSRVGNAPPVVKCGREGDSGKKAAAATKGVKTRDTVVETPKQQSSNTSFQKSSRPIEAVEAEGSLEIPKTETPKAGQLKVKKPEIEPRRRSGRLNGSCSNEGAPNRSPKRKSRSPPAEDMASPKKKPKLKGK